MLNLDTDLDKYESVGFKRFLEIHITKKKLIVYSNVQFPEDRKGTLILGKKAGEFKFKNKTLRKLLTSYPEARVIAA